MYGFWVGQSGPSSEQKVGELIIARDPDEIKTGRDHVNNMLSKLNVPIINEN